MGKLKEALLYALEGGRMGDRKTEEAVRNLLVYSLMPDEVNVFDAMTGNLEGIEGVKGKRGRPRKEEVGKESLTRAALRAEQKERARKQDRLNPQPTEELQKVQELNAELREAEWDMADLPDSREDALTMIADIDNLREEAGLEKLDDMFEPYAQYRRIWNEYYGIKKEAKELLEAVKEYMGNRDMKKAEEMLITLKKDIKRLNEGYKGVKEAYEEVCKELMSIAESRDKWGGEGNSGASAAMLMGFGMMEGEDGKKYQKRMKGLGRGSEIPKTIKRIDDRVIEAERRWRSIAGASPTELKEIRDNWQKSLRTLAGKVSIASNMRIADLNRLIEGRRGEKKRGRKAQAEKERKGGMLSTGAEKFIDRIGEECFGGDGEIRYGCLHTLSPAKGDNDTGSAYGRIVVRWKPQSAVATFLLGSTLDIASGSDNGMMPSLLSEASPCSFAPENRTMVETFRAGAVELDMKKLCEAAKVPYVELQLHGGEDKYRAQDIESISFGSEEDMRNLSVMAASIVNEFKIPLYIEEKKVEDEPQRGESEGKPEEEKEGGIEQ